MTSIRTGTVRMINRERGYLFITALVDTHPIDFFAPRIEVSHFAQITEGDVVAFTPIFNTPKGPRASGVHRQETPSS